MEASQEAPQEEAPDAFAFTVHSALVGILRAEGLAEDDVQDLATERLEEAVVRSREHVANYRDLAAWARAYADLRAWLRAVPAPAASP